MPLEVITLVSGATGTTTGTSDWVPVDHKRITAGQIPITVFGSGATAFSGSVTLQGAIATEQEANEGTLVGANISGGTWTGDSADALFVAFTHIRAVCTSYTAGPFSVRVLL